MSRSQFIAFQGNVVGSFALCMLIFYIFKFTVGTQVFTVTDAQQFWEELAYFYPKILWFASIAGFFLFLSGLLSGLVINDQRYHNITERIYLHPFLSRFFKQEKRRKIADWFDRNMGGVIGNVAFGFMMGSAFLVGKFLNIDFDIRHITFVAGNLAMGLAGLNFTGVTIKLLLVAVIAMFSVGAFNFLVSFSLSLILAMRSNKIKLRNIFPMAGSVIKAFFRNPVLFFFPPKNAPAATNGGLME